MRVIETVESANSYFAGGFADLRACIVLKKNIMKLEEIYKA